MRKRWLMAGAVGTAVVVSLCACGGSSGSASSAAGTGPFTWKRYAGQSITVLADQNSWQAAIQPLVPQFESLTGIKVNFESLPEDQFRQRRQVILTGQSSDIDVYMTQPVEDGPQFENNGWYVNLKPYVDNPSLTSSSYDYSDFSPGVIKGSTVSGSLIGIPILVDVEMLYYRKDILRQAGVPVPTTMTQLQQDAAKIKALNDGVYGYAARGDGGDAVTQLTTYLYNFGANWTNAKGLAGFDSPAGVKAFSFYGSLLRDYAPPGITSDSWTQLMPLFEQGKLAMWDDSSSFVGEILDPQNTTPTVLKNIGYAAMPAGPGGAYNATLPWSLAISPFSGQKGAAWQFIQWATDPSVVGELQASGVAGARQTVPFPASLPEQWVNVFQKEIKVARPKLPVVVPGSQVRDVIGTALVTCIQSQSKCASAVASAAANFNQVVKENS